MEFQPSRDLPACLQRRRPLPDDRSARSPRPQSSASGIMWSSIPAAASPASIFARSRAIRSSLRHLSGPQCRCGARPHKRGEGERSQKQDLAAFIHLCGAGPATAFARRHFQMMADERCGDHLVAAYVAHVNAPKRQFLRLAADGRTSPGVASVSYFRRLFPHILLRAPLQRRIASPTAKMTHQEPGLAATLGTSRQHENCGLQATLRQFRDGLARRCCERPHSAAF